MTNKKAPRPQRTFWEGTQLDLVDDITALGAVRLIDVTLTLTDVNSTAGNRLPNTKRVAGPFALTLAGAQALAQQLLHTVQRAQNLPPPKDAVKH